MCDVDFGNDRVAASMMLSEILLVSKSMSLVDVGIVLGIDDMRSVRIEV